MALIVAKNNLLLRALQDMEKDRKGISQLCELIDGQSALVGTTDNPFKLNKIMEATMTPAPAKGGELAPEDIGKNIDAIMARLMTRLERGEMNIASVYIKTSMGPSVRLL